MTAPAPTAVASPDSDANLIALHARLPLVPYLRSMWRRRDFAVALPVEELRASHQNTLLGNVWHLANPMLMVGVYYLVFAVVLDVHRRTDNYVLWMMIGVFTFGLTNKCVTGGATSIAKNQGLMRAIRFPRALLPVSVLVSKLLTFGFEISVLIVVALVTGEPVTLRWLALPLVVLTHSAFNLGGAFVAARLNDSYRDVEQIIPFVFRLLTYVSGVMIPLDPFLSGEQGTAVVREAIRLNPLYSMINLYRWSIMGLPMSVGEAIRVVVIAVAALALGFAFFRAAETRYGRA